MGNHPLFSYMTSQLKISITLGLLFIVIFGCSSSQETKVQKIETDSLYIFDEVPPEDIFKFESPEQQTFDVFVVQIGAFSSLEHAKEFAEESRMTLSRDIKVEYVQQKNLYVVWIHPPFENKIEAEAFRNEIRLKEEFKDAWIVTLESKK
ncbi:MAG: SPOR domain-containing protein [bacterium]|nr:SPOR domain-containing protein [bacterium]